MAQYVRACMRDPMNTQGKHTKCSWRAYSECCAALVQRRLPTCFSGRYLWKSLALVQRPVAFTASYSPFTKKEGLVISKDTRTHDPNGKTDSKSRLHFSAANALVQRFPILSMVGWNLFSPQLTWPRPSLKSKKFHLNTLIRMTYNNICKTTHLSTVNNSILMFFSTNPLVHGHC